MLSNPLQRFSPYHPLSSPTILSNSSTSPSQRQTSRLDGFGHGSPYGLQHLHHQAGPHASALTHAPLEKHHRSHGYGGPSVRSNGSTGPVRRRISRACDQCNQLRTKCDGQSPCAHCTEFGLGCEYNRERKKRGKASRKDLAQQAAAAASVSVHNGQSSPTLSNDNSSGAEPNNGNVRTEESMASSGKSTSGLEDNAAANHQEGEEMDDHDGLSPRPSQLEAQPHGLDRDHIGTPGSLGLSDYASIHNVYDRPAVDLHMASGGARAPYGPGQSELSAYSDIPFALQSSSNSASFRMGAPTMTGYPMPGGPTSPGWLPMPSPSAQYPSHIPHNSSTQQIRYPVLDPLLPHLGNIIPASLACDLIDLYFASSSSAHTHPMSPYVLGYVFRKKSFLHPTQPRHCQPALLASMLWVAAQTSDAPFLASVPSARGKICQRLLELTVSLLNPLIHTPSGTASPVISPVIDGVALGGLGVALPGSISLANLTGETGAFGAAGNLDDVITYIHLATVVSASEYKGASLRWWNAAWSLARELKLGRELPPGAASNGQINDDPAAEQMGSAMNSGMVTEEEREERRRIWWLTYIVDRHLALCYNRPLFLLDIECEGLLQPMDDIEWQSGRLASVGGPKAEERPRGPHFECTGHSIFGYFLPLMTILGEIVDLHHARNHPRFGLAFRSGWDDQAAEITRHLEAYEKSLRRFELGHLYGSVDDRGDQATRLQPPGLAGLAGDLDQGDSPSVRSVITSSSRISESDIQTRIVSSYGTHVMHVLHILLAGKWDPINLLDDNDLWISTQGFITATSHAVAAAEAISNILEYDPGLEFMPFFFGIYLLQGSFLLLLIADKLQLEASPSVVRACETIIRAHEACVVTLNTEYQRNFNKVMRSALAQIRGRLPEDLGEQHQRRRELLSLYRWTGDGTGLAL